MLGDEGGDEKGDEEGDPIVSIGEMLVLLLLMRRVLAKTSLVMREAIPL